MVRPWNTMKLAELYQCKASLYMQIDELRYQKRMANLWLKRFRLAGVDKLHIEDKLRELERKRREILMQIQMKKGNN